MKSFREIFTSQRFMKEISFLLFGFAAFIALTGVILIVAGPPDAPTIGFAVAGILVALVEAVLAIFIRRGSFVALWIAGILFVLDTVANLLEPTAALFWRGFLIVMLLRFIRRERASA